jgi:hypothetical protein
LVPFTGYLVVVEELGGLGSLDISVTTYAPVVDISVMPGTMYAGARVSVAHEYSIDPSFEVTGGDDACDPHPAATTPSGNARRSALRRSIMRS